MSDEANKFEVICASIGDAPTFAFQFHGDTVRAELAGATLYGEHEGNDRTRISLRAADGELLADITLHSRAHRDATENVIDVGSALLWSHWRWSRATAAKDRADLEVEVVDVGPQDIGELPTRDRKTRTSRSARKATTAATSGGKTVEIDTEARMCTVLEDRP